MEVRGRGERSERECGKRERREKWEEGGEARVKEEGGDKRRVDEGERQSWRWGNEKRGERRAEKRGGVG